MSARGYKDEGLELVEEINKLRKKHNAVILAHNYQIPAIQDIADHTGDSLDLSRKAAESEKNLIVFCGVHFMAESAAIFSPEKTILIPDLNAGCSLADCIDVKTLLKWKKKYPDAVVVCYVNTDAAVKAESDICCTSTNAVQVVNSIPKNKQILFVPDMFLGSYVKQITGRDIILYPGECHVHAKVKPKDITDKLDKNPDSDLLMHPECGCVSSCLHHLAKGDLPKEKVHILSTGGMLKFVKKSSKKKFLVATETGIIHTLKKQNSNKQFIPLREDMVCQFMKMITLSKLRDSLKYLQYEVKVDPKIAKKAKRGIERMFAVSS